MQNKKLGRMVAGWFKSSSIYVTFLLDTCVQKTVQVIHYVMWPFTGPADDAISLIKS